MEIEIIPSGIDDIDTYCRQILNGDIPSCIYTRQAVNRFQKDLEYQNTEDFPYYFEPEAAHHFFNFVESYLKHFQGHFSGKPIVLQPFQKFILGQLFGWLHTERKHDTAIRRFSEASIFMGKKNGKSMMGAFIALYFLLFEGDATEVYNIAINRNHSKKLSWNSAQKMIENSEELQELFNINHSIASLGIKCLDNNSYYEPIATKSDTADGLNVSCAIFDESKDNTDFKMVDTIKAGTTTRLNPLFVNISTAGFRTDTVGYDYYQRDIAILSGEEKRDNILSIIYTIDEGDEENWDSEEIWRKANPLFDESITQRHFNERIQEGRNKVRVKNDVLVKNLNLFGRSDKGWMDIEKWDACHKEGLTIEDVNHLPAIISFDLSKRLDLTNVKITFFEGNSINNVKVYPFDYFFLPEDRFSRDDDRSQKYLSLIQEWKDMGDLLVAGKSSIEYEIITDQIIQMWEEFNVRYVTYDPYQSETIIKDLAAVGLTDDDFINFNQSSYKDWNIAMKEMEKLIVDERIQHNGNKVMRWCMENVAIKEHSYNDTIKPIKISDEKRIDGVDTLGMSIWTYVISDMNKSQETKKLSPIAERIIKMRKQKEEI
ncbi:terminase large subunit [Aliifodinibius sp. S!AR15-10]|uniref:terminase large subunit n=1 Tax=Aliifodinibius sp. S!AR15-10 TaxID=2950437 RepID=UPI00285A8296|nr:terminase TerL endonuclease subunit [Aliifodinibius sp. S!AR15-10]MDR8390987.1 terminase large subunit [Aliifodinibius sp. S!AR15-10]